MAFPYRLSRYTNEGLGPVTERYDMCMIYPQLCGSIITSPAGGKITWSLSCQITRQPQPCQNPTDLTLQNHTEDANQYGPRRVH
jgi:hypothetical protein